MSKLSQNFQIFLLKTFRFFFNLESLVQIPIPIPDGIANCGDNNEDNDEGRVRINTFL